LVAGLKIPTVVESDGTITTRPSGISTPPQYAPIPGAGDNVAVLLYEFVAGLKRPIVVAVYGINMTRPSGKSTHPMKPLLAAIVPYVAPDAQNGNVPDTGVTRLTIFVSDALIVELLIVDGRRFRPCANRSTGAWIDDR
jgi:hypothetical protein